MEIPAITNKYGNVEAYTVDRLFDDESSTVIGRLRDQVRSGLPLELSKFGPLASPGSSWLSAGEVRLVTARLMPSWGLKDLDAAAEQRHVAAYNSLMAEQAETVGAWQPALPAELDPDQVDIMGSNQRNGYKRAGYYIGMYLKGETADAIMRERLAAIGRLSELKPGTDFNAILNNRNWRPHVSLFAADYKSTARQVRDSLRRAMYEEVNKPEYPKEGLTFLAPRPRIVQVFLSDERRSEYYRLKSASRWT